jgi:magnesium-transporting ATPase (P-type)
LQFQLTVNIVSCWLAMIGSAVLTVPPIGVLQLLWVNLIMDSFASLALATEDPNKPNGLKELVLSRFPYKRTDPLLSKLMVRNMFGHALLQLGVIFFIVFGMGDICEKGATHNVCAGNPVVDYVTTLRSGRPLEFDKLLMTDYEKWNCVPKYDKSSVLSYFKVEGLPLDGSGVEVTGVMPYRSSLYDVCGAGHSECGSPTQHFTMIFHSFVFMQVFNEINARKLNNEWNVFGGLQYHAMFIYIFFGTLGTQVRHPRDEGDLLVPSKNTDAFTSIQVQILTHLAALNAVPARGAARRQHHFWLRAPCQPSSKCQLSLLWLISRSTQKISRNTQNVYDFRVQEAWQHIFCFLMGVLALPWQACVVHF